MNNCLCSEPRDRAWTGLRNAPYIYNALGNALQVQYNGIKHKANAHFNVEEFDSLKNHIEEH